MKWWLSLVVLYLLCWAVLSVRGQTAIKITLEDSGCVTNNPCTVQMYRASCTNTNGMGIIQCPNYPDPSFLLLLNTTNTLSGTITSSGTQWVYTDKNGDTSRPDLVPAKMYGYAATAIYNGDTTRTPSSPSSTLSIPFQFNTANAPNYPITGACRIVK